MSTRAVIRHASWTIHPDRTPGASPPLRHVECTTCHAESDTMPAGEQAATDKWAIGHTGATGHTGYREVLTAFLRVTPAPGNPLHEEA